MKIHIATDHAGFEYKEDLIGLLKEKNIDFIDCGCDSPDSVDYPDYAHEVSIKVLDQKNSLGVLICGSANGVAMTANKYKEVRAGICWNEEIVKLVRQHNNANILCIPARFVSLEKALEMVETFINTSFDGGRHQLRINKINDKKS